MIQEQIEKLVGLKVVHTKNKNFGDYAVFSKNPEQIFKKAQNNKMFEKVEIVNNFVNFYLSKDFLRDAFKKIKIQKTKNPKKIQVEFISANPTGPITMGNGRGAFMGDCLANILQAVGHKVEREYYINDRGKQVEDLKKGLYPGETRTVQEIQKVNQKFIEKKLKIRFDNWFSEKSLYPKSIKQAEQKLKKYIFKKDKAIWLKTTKFGDDKDRVLIRKDGEQTYLLSDAAYFQNKMSRKFDLVINFWGADHHGYVPRFKSMIKACGYREEVWYPVLMQLVRLVKNGQEIKMSKRQGTYVTLEELVEQVGLDAARFFFLMCSADRHMNFDLSLAKEKSEKNPVFYVQYAHARIASILAKTQNSKFKKLKTQKLSHDAEFKLIRQLIKFPEIVSDIAQTYQVHKLPHYAIDLAKSFHFFYKCCKVVEEGKERLELVEQTKNILKQVLELMGISAPEKM